MKTIEENIKPGSTLIVAVSGGPDSVFLLTKCLEISKKYQLKLVVAHVNHGLRGRESDRDVDFVLRLAKKYKLPFECAKLHLAKKLRSGLEETARTLRYHFFEKVRKKHKADWILTAHHRDDNIETVLFNLIRGASFNGLKGMQKMATQRHLLRPMLQLAKQEILAYLKQKKLPYRIDKSNLQSRFSRNLLRNKVIPLLKKINRNFEQTFADNLENFRETANFMAQASNKFFEQHGGKNSFPLDNFLKLHPAMQKEVVVHLYKKMHGSSNQLTWKHLKQILKVLRQKKTGSKKEFGRGYYIEVKRDSKNKRTAQILKKSSKQVK